MVLAIAIAIHCDGCITYHVRDALYAGRHAGGDRRDDRRRRGVIGPGRHREDATG
jgi:hypothetical protein